MTTSRWPMQPVDLEGVPSGGVGQDHERSRGLRAGIQAEGFGQHLDRNGVSLDPNDGAPFGVCRRGGLMSLGQQHSMERQRETLAAGLDQQAAQVPRW